MVKTIIDNSYNASSVGGGSNWYTFRTLVVENSTNTANNTSNITVIFSAKYNYSGTGFSGYTSPKATIKIDNVQKKLETVSSLDSNWKTIATWTGDITHNTNGEKSITVLCTFEPNSTVSYLPENNTTGGSGALTKIARYTSIKAFSVSKRSETSVTFNWETADIVDYVWFSKDNGANWSGLDVDGMSGSFNVGSLSSNTSYNFKLRVRRKDSQLATDSSVVSQTTYDYPHCTDTPDFTIGNLLTLKLYNPLKRNIVVQLVGNDNSIVDTWTGNATSISGYNATVTINNLYASIPNSRSGIYQVRVTYGDVTKTSNGIYLIKGTEIPYLGNFNYEDSNANVVSSTGNKLFIIKNLSDLKVVIPSANKMVAKNFATPFRYEISCGNRSTSVDYGTGDVSVNLGTISNSGNTDIVVKAYDSRGLSVTKKVTVAIIDYTNIVQKNTFARLNNFENSTTLMTKGTFSLVNCGGTSKNIIQSIRYRYAKVKDSYGSTWFSLEPTININEYSCSDVTLDLDNRNSWKIQIEIKDKFTTSTIELTVSEGISILYINTSKKNVGVGKINDTGGQYSLAIAGDLILKDNKTLEETIRGTSLLETNGYQKLPSGLMLQWGTEEVVLSSTEVDKVITFPCNFDNSCFTAIANVSDVGPNSTTFTTSLGCIAVSKNGAIFKIKSTSNFVSGKNTNIRYFAIGF